MINIRHCGIYVENITKMELFYENVFHMYYICKQEVGSGKEFDILVGANDAKVLISKLITDEGRVTGRGNMIELLQVIIPKQKSGNVVKKLTNPGIMHIAIECQFEDTIPLVEEYEGKVVINPVVMKSGNKMCFITDPEGNYIELIERL